MVEQLPPSIFNDVIGPVMRGPSSSHVAGAARIASLVRQSLAGPVRSVLVEFDPAGSLAESHDGHGTDLGFLAGLLDLELDDPALPRVKEIARERGLSVQFAIRAYGAAHPNHYRVTAEAVGERVHWDAISVGGGMVEMLAYNGVPLSICGDYDELLVTPAQASWTQVKQALQQLLPAARVHECRAAAGQVLLQLKSTEPLQEGLPGQVRQLSGVERVAHLRPVLPTRAVANCRVPFLTADELLQAASAQPLPLWQYAVQYESRRGGLAAAQVRERMEALLAIMEHAVDEGLAGTVYADRILGPQANKLRAAAGLMPAEVLNRTIEAVTAIMEVKSAMGVIVAAPTAGSCGCLPGALIGVARALALPRAAVVEGLLAAGVVGVLIAQAATFAAEVAGCQVECGAGSAMAAAGLTQMFGGTPQQCLDAAALALQNLTGLACDPVANRVEVPCLGKNLLGAVNAITCTNLALAGFDKVIPLDETIAAVYEIGRQLPLSLRCTRGGLGNTPTSRAIQRRLAQNMQAD